MNRPSLWLALMMLAAALFGAAGHTHHSPPADDMAAAAKRFLDSLGPDLRARAALPFDSAARSDWHFVPRDRPGVTFADMSDAQRTAARDLLRSALSAAGVLKVESIMQLDSVLRDMERAAGGDGASRDPLKYTLAVYGDPATAGPQAPPWGWKIEGHHISLNFTLRAGRIVSVTPSFLGANPAQVASGPMAGRRALAAEEDLGRQLLLSLDDSQRKAAVIADKAPADILTLPGRPLGAAAAVGLESTAMTDVQRSTLRQLIDEFAHNLRPELAHEQLERMLGDKMEGVRFAWAGGSARAGEGGGDGHYYRITGRTFVIEYDNTQDHANHVHTVWHDLERDFGGDALRDHLERDHKHEH